MTAPYIPPPDQQTVMQTLLSLVGRAQPQPQRPLSFGDEVFAHLYQLARAAQDATRVNNAPPQQPQWTIGAATPGNTPLPEATVQSQYQPKYDKAMNLLADLIPVLGSIRGVHQGHEMAQAGNPWLGAISAAAALAPEGGNLAAKGIKSVAVHSAADAEREALDRLLKTTDKIVAGTRGTGAALDPALPIFDRQTILEIMDRNSPGEALNYGRIRSSLGAGPYTKTRIPISSLDAMEYSPAAHVDPARATPSKGAIIVGPRGDIIDGRHRVALAAQNGQTHIDAYVPIERLFGPVGPYRP